MNYIYDVYINLNKKYFDLYDWDKKDNIIHIKKIPFFRIQNKDLQTIINDDIKVDLNFLKYINNKTEFFDKVHKNFLCCFTDTRDDIVVQMNKDGNIIRKSTVHFTDKNENIRTIKTANLINLNYSVINSLPIDILSRKEYEKKIFLINSIDSLDKQKLTYLYFECFNKRFDNDKLMRERLITEISNGNENVWTITYNFFKLIHQY